MNPTHKNQIEAYLRDELNPEQMNQFHAHMESNPDFAQQVRFEEKIVKGLSEVRKAELKARLDAIDVTPVGWVGGIGQLANNAVVKTLGGIAAASIVGVVLYNIVDLDGEQSIDTSKTITTEINHPQDQEQASTSWKDLIPEETIDRQYAEQSEEQQFVAAPMKEVKEELIEVSPEEVASLEKSSEDFTPEVSVPQPGDLAKEDGLTTPDSRLPEVTASDELIDKEPVAVDVETVNRKNEALKYKYFDGKLFLYGDFSENPYEILEINGVKERKLYLYFEQNYFSIEVTDKVKELNELSDRRLINELEIIRNNKL
ncbi:anti-sigma factor family protein [Marinoscillum sp.]|uniref:anti-sigma factor family protein n=1 Tax=Marinoscillum sp. TaxID=2024838 RepID=UPI003BA8519C